MSLMVSGWLKPFIVKQLCQTTKMPNSTETSIKPSGTKSFGVMRRKWNFLAKTINTTFGEDLPRPVMKGTPLLL